MNHNSAEWGNDKGSQLVNVYQYLYASSNLDKKSLTIYGCNLKKWCRFITIYCEYFKVKWLIHHLLFCQTSHYEQNLLIEACLVSKYTFYEGLIKVQLCYF